MWGCRARMPVSPVQADSQSIRYPCVGNIKRQGESPEFDNKNRTTLTPYLVRYCEPLDLSRQLERFADVPVLILGEVHTTPDLKSNLTKQLQTFRQAGYTHLALEMLGENHQEDVDQYSSVPSSKKKVDDALRYEWGHTSPQNLEFYQEAVRLGFQVIAADLPRIEKRKFPDNKQREMDRKRDETMAGHMARVVKSSDQHRVLALVGGMHGRPESIPRALRELGVESKFLELTFPSHFLVYTTDSTDLRKYDTFMPLPGPPKFYAHGAIHFGYVGPFTAKTRN